MSERIAYSPGRAARFYVPLLLQAFSQSLTYPLVGAIISHGADGVDGLTAFSLGQVIMFMIGALGGGLIMTGMVFAKTREGLASFRRLNTLMMMVLLTIQMFVCIHPIDTFFFERLLNLSPHLAEIARRTTFFGVVMQAAFFLRNVPLVLLFNAYASFEANLATAARIALTFAFTLTFPRMGWVGPDWGLFALTVPVVLEWLLSEVFAAKYERRLVGGATDGVLAQFKFTMPLSIGSCLLAVSPFMTAAFVGRAANPTDMLAIHYVTLGIANPVSFAALRMQAVSIQFPPEWPGDRRLLRFALVVGLLLGIIPLVFATPLIGGWYYGGCQNIPPRILGTTRFVSFLYSFICVIHAVRGRVEGLAAIRKRPSAVMAGQVGYFVALVIVLALTLPLGIPGWAMAVIAIYVAPVAATAATYAGLGRGGKENRDAAGGNGIIRGVGEERIHATEDLKDGCR